MFLNPLAPVIDYQSMLNRIFWFTTASALVAVWMLRIYIPALDELLNRIDFTVQFGSDKVLPVPGGFLMPALAVGMLTRIYRAHAHVSHWLGLRECFDVDVIITEFAAQLSIDLSQMPRARVSEARHRIMRKAFYSFVSGPQPQIDRQLVEQALDSWSWFWVGIEATLVFLLTSLALVAGGVYATGFQTMGGTLVLAAIGLPAMRGQCQRYAVAQVRAILADPARALAVRAALSELIGIRVVGRHAA